MSERTFVPTVYQAGDNGYWPEEGDYTLMRWSNVYGEWVEDVSLGIVDGNYWFYLPEDPIGGIIMSNKNEQFNVSVVYQAGDNGYWPEDGEYLLMIWGNRIKQWYKYNASFIVEGDYWFYLPEDPIDNAKKNS